MALRKPKGPVEAEWLFGWNPYDYVDDQVTLNQDGELKQAFECRLAELGLSAYLGTMTPVRFVHEGKRKELGPDLYVVAECDPRERKFWQVWDEEERYPTLIVEFLSKSTQRNDRNATDGKMWLYASVFRTPEYYLYDPEKLTLEAYRLEGDHYIRVLPDAAGRVPCILACGYLGIENGRIRLYRQDGTRVPHHDERAERERLRAEAAEARAEAAEAEVARLRRLLESEK